MQIIIDTNTNQTTGLSKSVLIDINDRHQKKRIPYSHTKSSLRFSDSPRVGVGRE